MLLRRPSIASPRQHFDGAERVLRGFQERRTPGESFAAYVARAEEAWLL